MKTLLVGIIGFVVTTILLYLGQAFVYNEFNTSVWSQEDRAGLVVLIALFSTTIGLASAAIFNDNKDYKKNKDETFGKSQIKHEAANS